jgi:nicotinamidase-related amidase
MADALIALHYQNDICHPDGRVPFSLDRTSPEAAAFLAASVRALSAARGRGMTIVHVHIGFADDYSDLPRHGRLFRKAAELGALKRGSWGAAPFEGFEPGPGEDVLWHSCNSAFRNTGLEALLRKHDADRLYVMGLATQFSVEHTIRDATDMGFAVTLLSDCCASGDMEAHRASLRSMAMLAEIETSAALTQR